MITKMMIKTLTLIANGIDKTNEIAKAMNLSRTWVSDIITKLEEQKFITRRRKGNRTYLELAETSFAQGFKHLIKTKPYIKFESFLYGLNFRILSYCLFSHKTSKNIAHQLSLKEKTIWNRLPTLANRGLLDGVRRDRYVTNKKAWPALYEFLEKYRMFSLLPGRILWGFENKMLFEVTRKEDIQGALTGFSKYPELGIPIRSNIFCCYLPQKKLSKEEFFIHSILETENSREILLVLTFYLKHRLNKEKLIDLAMSYDCTEKLEDLDKLLKQENTKVLPFIKEKEIREFLKTYDIKWKKD